MVTGQIGPTNVSQKNLISVNIDYDMDTTNLETAKNLRLTKEEYGLIQEKLGRVPNFTELCCFSAMWSEHCSYKNSIKWLKTLPREGKGMLVAAGEENAGLMDIGNGYGVVFKIESHNHPSALEPFQGAATGVGGILRDIFTMGARPIATLNSLRFGNLDDNKTKHLLSGVVKGIGHYGNCFGVPTVGGEVYFEDCYRTNPLVNAMSVGIVEIGKTVSAIAKGAGNPVVYVGSATGKDGIGGASFASADITEESIKELPAVQVGDPFQEKKLLEACLEVLSTGAVVGMQDMGAAGIICSTSEMSAKGGVGMRIDLDKVPARQAGMKAWELLLSESQERMLLVLEKGREAEVEAIFAKWDLHASVIGEVTDGGTIEFHLNGKLEAALPAHELVLGGGAPQYEREFRKPGYLEQVEAFDQTSIPDITLDELKSYTEKLLELPNIASKEWIYTQYDSMVGAANMGTNDPSDAAVVLVKETGKALALTVDCNSRYVYMDPYFGAMAAVQEAYRNIVCSGGRPIGITNCLNFGNPYDPEVYYQFVQSIKGMGKACEWCNTPVTGGNVSFYNQGPEGAVYPTPTIGMVGLIDDPCKRLSLSFKNPGDLIFLIGDPGHLINCSEYLHKLRNVTYSPHPCIDLTTDDMNYDRILEANEQGLLRSAHDISEGGLIVALMEAGFHNRLGFEVNGDYQMGGRFDSYWMSEDQGRAVVSVNASHLEAFEKCFSGCNYTQLGKVVDGNIKIDGVDWGAIDHWHGIYAGALAAKLAKN